MGGVDFDFNNIILCSIGELLRFICGFALVTNQMVWQWEGIKDWIYLIVTVRMIDIRMRSLWC